MLRATGFGKPLLAPWPRRRQPAGPRTAFGTRPVRMAAGIAVAALVVGNAVIVYRLMGEDTSPVGRVLQAPGREEAAGASFKELREALQGVQASIKADVERVKPSRVERSERNDKPKETSSSGTVAASSGTSSSGSSSSGSTSSGSSGGSSSTGSDTDSGSGGGSGGSSGGDDTGGGDTGGGGGPGGGGDTGGGGGGDTGGGGSSGGGGGG